MIETDDCMIVLTTWPEAADAAHLASVLVEERLAACVNIGAAMESIYRWKGELQRDRERQMVIKTSRARLSALEARVRQLHPYEVPELLVLSVVQGNAEYLRWLSESTS